MKINKSIFILLSLMVSSLAFADPIPTATPSPMEISCAASTQYVVGNPAHLAEYNVCIVRANCTEASNQILDLQQRLAAFNSCVAESQSGQTAPPNPGPSPANPCIGLVGAPASECNAAYVLQLQAYNQQVNAYNQYLQNPQGGGTTQLQTASATKTLEDITAKQAEAATQMSSKSSMLTGIGMALIAAGIAIMFLNPTVGGIMVAAGGVLLVYGLVTKGKSKALVNSANATCLQYNQLAVKPLNCPTAQQQPTGDGVITISTSGTGVVPAFIDPVTGLCRPGAPIECKTITKNLAAGCFQKGGACLAGGKSKAPQVVAKNGKVTMDLNGSKRTFGLEDFSSEAAMVKAGFTPAQAKQFYGDMNSADSILAKNGLNAKGDLKNLITGPMPVGAAASSGGSTGASAMKVEQDKYGPAVREPASAEGLTKDYHGDTIGADGDDVFKMINRRYRVKKLQNIFIEE